MTRQEEIERLIEVALEALRRAEKLEKKGGPLRLNEAKHRRTDAWLWLRRASELAKGVG